MKKLFPGYYSLNQEQFKELWENCIFVFDTNILLNLYRYSKNTRNDFTNNILRKIEERLWIPHQVALEFQEKRLTLIESQQTQIDTIKSKWEKHKTAFLGDIRKFYSVNPKSLIGRLDKELLEYLNTKNSLIYEKLELTKHDAIRDIVDELFHGKIGEIPAKGTLMDIYKDGQERYKIKYPPGFCDHYKKEKSKYPPYLYKEMEFKREYGDLILWKELLKEVESRNWKHIIFITDDEKEDWWNINSGKTIGPRLELIQEMDEAGVSLFYMYNSKGFIRFAEEHLGTKISDYSKQEIEEIADLNKYLPAALIGLKVERAVFEWLIGEYPDELITHNERIRDSYIDILRDSNGSKVGYTVKYRKGKVINLTTLRESIIKMQLTISRESLDFGYIVIATDQIENDSSMWLVAVKKIIQDLEFADKLGFIVGGIYVQRDGTGADKYIFQEFSTIKVQSDNA
ncbi:PIN-like domain-containing protein [Laspinema palackyanum]|uniref:PIN-like domain-containing protein n=1 Tax=Laspinema palackyanum TaxID=3231601 RepID=UPI00345CD2E7|nr:PIN-like domain-containing protein [Laspinema sp. D2c]